MRFKPEGGLTAEHYHRLGTGPLERVQLARAVIENLLKRRGHGLRAIEEAFREVKDEALPGLVGEYSFEAMADAFEVTIRSPRSPSNTGLGKGTPDTSRVVCPGPTCFRDEPLPPAFVEILHHLKALETRIDDVDKRCRPRAESKGTPPRTFLHAGEAADYLGITVKALYSLKDRGKLRSLPGSRKLRFTPKMLDDYLHGRK